jgi:hypothetical protein
MEIGPTLVEADNAAVSLSLLIELTPGMSIEGVTASAELIGPDGSSKPVMLAGTAPQTSGKLTFEASINGMREMGMYLIKANVVGLQGFGALEKSFVLLK